MPQNVDLVWLHSSHDGEVPVRKNRIKAWLDQMFFLLNGLTQPKPKIKKTYFFWFTISICTVTAEEAMACLKQSTSNLLRRAREFCILTPDCSKNAERRTLAWWWKLLFDHKSWIRAALKSFIEEREMSIFLYGWGAKILSLPQNGPVSKWALKI